MFSVENRLFSGIQVERNHLTLRHSLRSETSSKFSWAIWSTRDWILGEKTRASLVPGGMSKAGAFASAAAAVELYLQQKHLLAILGSNARRFMVGVKKGLLEKSSTLFRRIKPEPEQTADCRGAVVPPISRSSRTFRQRLIIFTRLFGPIFDHLYRRYGDKHNLDHQ